MKGRVLEPGTQVRITANKSGHVFKIGAVCSVVESRVMEPPVPAVVSFLSPPGKYKIKKVFENSAIPAVTCWVFNDEIELVKEPKVETGCIVLGIIVVLFWFFVGAIIYAAF